MFTARFQGRLLGFTVLVAMLWAALGMNSGCDRRPAPVTQPGPRIVALSPAIGIILTDLGLGKAIVGRHGYDTFLPAELPTCGDQGGVDYERLIKLSPTHVFTQWGKREYPDKLRRLASERGWKLVDCDLTSLEDIRAGTREIDAVMGGGPQGSASLHALEARMEAAWAHRDGFERVGRVLLLAAVANPPAAFGPGSCHHEILVRLGATPAIGAGAPYISLDAEDLIRLAPDAIVAIVPRGAGSAPTSPQDALAPLKLLNLPAVRSGRLALIDDPAAQIPATSMIGFAEELAGVLERWKQGV